MVLPDLVHKSWAIRFVRPPFWYEFVEHDIAEHGIDGIAVQLTEGPDDARVISDDAPIVVPVREVSNDALVHPIPERDTLLVIAMSLVVAI